MPIDKPLLARARVGRADRFPSAKARRRMAAFMSVTSMAFVLAVIGPAGSVVTPAAASGTTTQYTISHNGLDRNYFEYVPDGLPTSDVPLVFVLHGGTESAEQAMEQKRPSSHWMTLADADKFIVVYPNAAEGPDGKQNWNDCRGDATNLPDVDDVSFIDTVIGQVSARHNIDLARVDATGASNGGLMSYRLALELSHKVAAVGAVIANMAAVSECSAPVNPTSVMIMNGDGDPLMPWDGGCLKTDCSSGSVLSAAATRDFWTSFNDTSTSPNVHDYPNVNTQDNSEVRRERYTSGSQGTEVVFFHVRKTGVKGAGHAEPSICCKIGKPAEAFVGKQNKDIEGPAELWSFMKAHTLTT